MLENFYYLYAILENNDSKELKNYIFYLKLNSNKNYGNKQS